MNTNRNRQVFWWWWRTRPWSHCFFSFIDTLQTKLLWQLSLTRHIQTAYIYIWAWYREFRVPCWRRRFRRMLFPLFFSYLHLPMSFGCNSAFYLDINDNEIRSETNGTRSLDVSRLMLSVNNVCFLSFVMWYNDCINHTICKVPMAPQSDKKRAVTVVLLR